MTVPAGLSPVPVPMPIVDDTIDEVLEEGFLAVITVGEEGATFPELVDRDVSQLTLGRIADDDSMCNDM